MISGCQNLGWFRWWFFVVAGFFHSSLHLCLVAGDQCSGHSGGEAEGSWDYPSVTLTRCLFGPIFTLVLYSWFHLPGLLFLVWYSWCYLLSDFRCQISVFRFDISDFRFQMSYSRLQFQTPYFIFQVQISDSRFQVLCFMCHISDFIFPIPYFKFQVSCFRFRLQFSYFGFQI